jgi:hypothetical protein
VGVEEKCLATVIREGVTMNAHGVRLIYIVSLMLLAPGCVGLTAAQKAAIAEFSRATTAVGETTQSELTEMRERMIRTNQERLILRGPLPTLAFASSLDGNLTVSNVSVVVAAATALEGYGEMLEALVEDTQTKELHGAAEKFAASVKQVPNVTLSPGASDAISAVIVLGGQMLIEAKKAHAIKAIVPQAKPAIDQICDVLTRDFDFTKAGLAADLHAATEALHGAASAALQDAPSGGAASIDAALAVRAVSLPALQYSIQGRLRRDEILTRISAAAAAIKKANTALAAALEHDRFTLDDVKGLVGEATALKPAITELSKQAGQLLDRVKILAPGRMSR